MHGAIIIWGGKSEKHRSRMWSKQKNVDGNLSFITSFREISIFVMFFFFGWEYPNSLRRIHWTWVWVVKVLNSSILRTSKASISIYFYFKTMLQVVAEMSRYSHGFSSQRRASYSRGLFSFFNEKFFEKWRRKQKLLYQHWISSPWFLIKFYDSFVFSSSSVLLFFVFFRYRDFVGRLLEASFGLLKEILTKSGISFILKKMFLWGFKSKPEGIGGTREHKRTFRKWAMRGRNFRIKSKQIAALKWQGREWWRRKLLSI